MVRHIARRDQAAKTSGIHLALPVRAGLAPYGLQCQIIQCPLIQHPTDVSLRLTENFAKRIIQRRSPPRKTGGATPGI